MELNRPHACLRIHPSRSPLHSVVTIRSLTRTKTRSFSSRYTEIISLPLHGFPQRFCLKSLLCASRRMSPSINSVFGILVTGSRSLMFVNTGVYLLCHILCCGASSILRLSILTGSRNSCLARKTYHSASRCNPVRWVALLPKTNSAFCGRC